MWRGSREGSVNLGGRVIKEGGMWRGSREGSVNLGGRVIKEGECGEVVERGV